MRAVGPEVRGRGLGERVAPGLGPKGIREHLHQRVRRRQVAFDRGVQIGRRGGRATLASGAVGGHQALAVAAAPTLLCNQSYDEGRVLGWNPETFEITTT